MNREDIEKRAGEIINTLDSKYSQLYQLIARLADRSNPKDNLAVKAAEMVAGSEATIGKPFSDEALLEQYNSAMGKVLNITPQEKQQAGVMSRFFGSDRPR